MIPSHEAVHDLSNWIAEARSVNNLSDLQLAFSVEINRIGHVMEGLQSAETTSKHFREYILDLLKTFRIKWLDGAGKRKRYTRY